MQLVSQKVLTFEITLKSILNPIISLRADFPTAQEKSISPAQ